ncbi:hypothetical protein GOP47_0016383 [Adiantum capillus-veneris]|uniref:Methenyltetrahydrofolate synthase domain-containing protein n=1 Tax=Adiantum capillus-veneris TaxID=13818 RepID=A0A9D4UHI9_ADICA|nr:hypothetical protein GOP47_0016383 [Adiantum capillus-veneris]
MAFLRRAGARVLGAKRRTASALHVENLQRVFVGSMFDGDSVLQQTATLCSVSPEGDSDADHLHLDEETRQHMADVAYAAVATSDTSNAHNGAWKWAIRQRIWDLLEQENIAMHPLPVHHRIPNFMGALTAASQLASLPAFMSAECIKVNPDTPQKQVRFLTLSSKKKLLVPQPRLRTGFFSEMEASTLPRGTLAAASSAAGAAKYGKPRGINAKLKVDLIVIGSVAVDPKTGVRIGKGEGFADLEYGMLRHMGAADDTTIVATTVHDKQLVDDIPINMLCAHDVPVDIICTPTQVIFTETTLSKPQGIYWDLLSPEKLSKISVLQELKKQIELETGQELPVGPSEVLPPPAERKKAPEKTSKDARIFVWNLNRSTQWTDLRDHIASMGAEALKVNVIRKEPKSKPVARILLKEGTDVESLVEALDGSQLGMGMIRAQKDNSSN